MTAQKSADAKVDAIGAITPRAPRKPSPAPYSARPVFFFSYVSTVSVLGQTIGLLESAMKSGSTATGWTRNVRDHALRRGKRQAALLRGHFTSINADVDHTEHNGDVSPHGAGRRKESRSRIDRRGNGGRQRRRGRVLKDQESITASRTDPEHMSRKRKAGDWYSHDSSAYAKVEREYGRGLT